MTEEKVQYLDSIREQLGLPKDTADKALKAVRTEVYGSAAGTCSTESVPQDARQQLVDIYLCPVSLTPYKAERSTLALGGTTHRHAPGNLGLGGLAALVA
jgi:hypothetical protein